ncbi:hypothetical protein BKA82DRAFT_4016277 [Pisolithus tinctorius]|nr:hypothetical protein BKA82DRAFT_4016277 [Pisolithus tinctorius]
MTRTLLGPWNFIQEWVMVTMRNGLQIFFQQRLRPDELQILQDGLKDWKEADANKRASLMEGMQNEIKWLDANKSLKQNEWNRKQAAVKNWMYNNSQSWAQEALVKYGSKWTTLKVIKLQHKKDIQQVLVKARIQPGTSAMIKHYQLAIQKVVQSLTKAELDQAAHLVKEWNERKLPPEAQAEVATSKGQNVGMTSMMSWAMESSIWIGKTFMESVNFIDGSNYRHHSEEEPDPPTKPSTKQQQIDDHPTGTSNVQEENRQWNQSTSDWCNTTTAYPKPADNHANVVAIQLQGSPSPSQESDPMVSFHAHLVGPLITAFYSSPE